MAAAGMILWGFFVLCAPCGEDTWEQRNSDENLSWFLGSTSLVLRNENEGEVAKFHCLLDGFPVNKNKFSPNAFNTCLIVEK